MAVATAVPATTVAPSRLRAAFAGTPGRLRAYLAVALVAVVVFGLVAGQSAASRRQSLISARQAAAQAVRIQQVHTSLVAADALATNAFLVGGLEPAQQRTGYQDGINTAAETLTTAASEADPSDVVGLQKVSASLATYTGLIESARANNRQGFPVGVAYLKQASTLLRSDVIPVLDQVSQSSQRRVDDAYQSSDNARYGFWVTAILVLIVLVGVQWTLAVSTRRTFNIPLLASSALILGAVVYAGAAMALAGSDAATARSGSYHATSALASARIDAYTAKSAESLTLISRGSGAAYEEQWKASYAEATTAIQSIGGGGTLGAELSAYADVHTAIRAADDGGDWDGAVVKATGFDPGSSNQTFGVFADNSASQIDTASTSLDGQLGNASSTLDSTRSLLLILSALAVLATALGFNRRLREYR